MKTPDSKTRLTIVNQDIELFIIIPEFFGELLYGFQT